MRGWGCGTLSVWFPSTLRTKLCIQLMSFFISPLGRTYRGQLLGYKFVPYYLLEGWTWANVLTAPSLSFFISRCQLWQWYLMGLSWGQRRQSMGCPWRWVCSMLVIVTWGCRHPHRSLRPYSRWGFLISCPTVQRLGPPTATRRAKHVLMTGTQSWTYLRKRESTDYLPPSLECIPVAVILLS